jgi:hypothetical protein
MTAKLMTPKVLTAERMTLRDDTFHVMTNKFEDRFAERHHGVIRNGHPRSGHHKDG